MDAKFAEVLAEGVEQIWVARLKEDGRFVGLFSLAPHHDGDGVELSYEVAEAMRGRGLAVDVAGCLRDYALGAMGLSKVLAETQMANGPSCRLLEKLGFELERTVERFGALQGVFVRRA